MPDTLQISIADDQDEAGAVFESSMEQGWGDGLPLIPPTPARVAAMIAAGGREPDALVAVLPPKNGQATVAKVAVNAVMAGCLPAYFPIVLAAIDALVDPKYELYGTNTTTNPVAPLTIVNGPLRQTLGINCSWGVLGPYFRANATIGRAISLCMINIAGRIPEEVSKSTAAQPGRYTFCVGEYEEESPWEPLHVERGFPKDASTVTLLAATGTTNIVDTDSLTADDLALTMAQAMCTCGTNNWIFFGLGEFGLMISPPHAQLLAQKFTTKRQLQEYFHETCRIPVHSFPAARFQRMKERGRHIIDERGVWVTNRPEQYLILVAGGLGGYHSVHLPTFGDSYAVTREVNIP